LNCLWYFRKIGKAGIKQVSILEASDD